MTQPLRQQASSAEPWETRASEAREAGPVVSWIERNSDALWYTILGIGAVLGTYILVAKYALNHLGQ